MPLRPILVATLCAASACAAPRENAPPATPSASSTPSTEPPAPKSAVQFPAAPKPIASQQHGQDVWGVYLVTADDATAEYQRAVADWRATGLPISNGELACDRGAAESGISGKLYVAVYFTNKGDAEAFAAKTTPRPAGIARITIMCAD